MPAAKPTRKVIAIKRRVTETIAILTELEFGPKQRNEIAASHYLPCWIFSRTQGGQMPKHPCEESLRSLTSSPPPTASATRQILGKRSETTP